MLNNEVMSEARACKRLCQEERDAVEQGGGENGGTLILNEN